MYYGQYYKKLFSVKINCYLFRKAIYHYGKNIILLQTIKNMLKTESFLMKKTFIKLTAAVMAVATLAVGSVGMSASAYTSKSSWDVYYVYGAPGNVNPTAYCTIYTYGGGYKTYCSSITGSNNRKVNVTAPGINYDITTTGYSGTKYSSATGDNVTFKFYATGSSTCDANGTVGYP